MIYLSEKEYGGAYKTNKELCKQIPGDWHDFIMIYKRENIDYEVVYKKGMEDKPYSKKNYTRKWKRKWVSIGAICKRCNAVKLNLEVIKKLKNF